MFISYSHKDDEWRKKLDAHLSLLKRQGLLDVWHDRCLRGGEDWAKSIDDQLRSADLVLLLVSADFMKSDYCFGLEMETALAQDEHGRSFVVPILLRACDWETAPFARCQGFPRDNQPVATHPAGEDAALTDVTKELRKLVEE